MTTIGRSTNREGETQARYYPSALRSGQAFPSTGRFLSKDPVPYLQRYAYVFNNPANLVDPSGLSPLGDQLGETAQALSDCAVAASRLNDSAAKMCMGLLKEILALEAAFIASFHGLVKDAWDRVVEVAGEVKEWLSDPEHVGFVLQAVGTAGMYACALGATAVCVPALVVYGGGLILRVRYADSQYERDYGFILGVGGLAFGPKGATASLLLTLNMVIDDEPPVAEALGLDEDETERGPIEFGGLTLP